MVKSFRKTVPISLLRAVMRAGRAFQEAGARVAESYGLHISEMNVIDTLGNTDGMRMGEVASRMLVSAPNLTRLVKGLEARGLAYRARAENSDREVIVRLTAAGERLFEQTYPAGFAAVRALVDERLNAKEQQTLLALLRKFNRNQD